MSKNHLSLRRSAALTVLLALLVAMMTAPVQASGTANFGSEFVHVVTEDNDGCGETMYCSIIDNPLTNNNPDAILFVTQTGEVEGEPLAAWNPNPIGVRYENGHWQIVNENMVTMPLGAAFNVLVAEAGPNVYVHEYSAPSGVPAPVGITYLDHPLTNNNPYAIVMITHVIGSGGILNPHYATTYYNEESGTWMIFNQDEDNMLYGTTFNVWVLPEANAVAFTQVVDEDNLEPLASLVTILNHPLLNKNLSAHIQITPVLYGRDYALNDSPIRLIYAQDQWRIANHIGTPIAVDAAFNVVITNMDKLVPELVNGRFEIQGVNAKTPYSWHVIDGLGVLGANNKARRICTEGTSVKLVGENCAFRFKGAAKAHHLVQALPVDNVQSDHIVRLTALVSGKNLTPGSVAMRVIAKYPGGGKQKIKIPAEILNAGTYNEAVVVASDELTEKPKKLVVKVSMFGSSGQFWVDNVEVLIYSEKEEAKLPLPLPLPPTN